MKKLIIILMLIMILPVVSSQIIDPTINVEQDVCAIIVQSCANCTYVNITSLSYVSNSTVILTDVSMTARGSDYNYTFCETNLTGYYLINFIGDDDGVDTIDSYYMEVTSHGIPHSDQRTDAITRAIYFISVIAVILFLAFLFYKSSEPVKWTFFIFSIIFFLIAINLISITLVDEVSNPKIETLFDGLAGISFIFYWFAAGILIIMWIFTVINTWFYQKAMKEFKKQDM